MGAASTVGPYFATNQLKMLVSPPPPATCARKLADHAVRIGAANVIALQKDLTAAANADHLVTDAGELRRRVSRTDGGKRNHEDKRHLQHAAAQQSNGVGSPDLTIISRLPQPAIRARATALARCARCQGRTQAWRKCKEGARDHDGHTDPDPRDQRVEEDLDDGPAGLWDCGLRTRHTDRAAAWSGSPPWSRWSGWQL